MNYFLRTYSSGFWSTPLLYCLKKNYFCGKVLRSEAKSCFQERSSLIFLNKAISNIKNKYGKPNDIVIAYIQRIKQLTVLYGVNQKTVYDFDVGRLKDISLYVWITVTFL